MGTENGTIALLQRALRQTEEIITALRPEDVSIHTPCPAWDVQSLVRHLTTQDLPNFEMAARGETPDWAAPPGELEGDWAEAFREGARRLLETWRAADLDRPMPMPGGKEVPLRSRADQQIAELAAHDWDLVRATGVQVALDPDVAEHALGWARQALRPEFRGPDKSFGFEVPVSDEAPAYDRLAAWFGRDPDWTPETRAPHDPS